jgi:hypothetical protein
MQRFHFVGVGALALSLCVTARAQAQFEPDGLSAFEQAASADIIVIGKVTEIEPEPILADGAKGKDKLLHLVATIRVEENLQGAKGVTHVRVAFVPELRAPRRNPAVKVLG